MKRVAIQDDLPAGNCYRVTVQAGVDGYSMRTKTHVVIIVYAMTISGN